MNPTSELDFPQQCRTCGGPIDEGEGVFHEDDDDAAYYHHRCFTH